MKNETRYFVLDVVSVGVVRLSKKSEAYRLATGPGWGTVEWYREVKTTDFHGNERTEMRAANRDRSDKTQVLLCNEDSSAVLYTEDGRECVISPDEDITLKKMPKQAEIRAMIISDPSGYSIWAKDIGDIKIFVTRDDNGLIEDYRLDNWTGKPYDGESEITFNDLQSEEDYLKIPREHIKGTIENSKKEGKYEYRNTV